MNLDVLAYIIILMVGISVGMYISWLSYLWWKYDKLGVYVVLSGISICAALIWAIQRMYL